MNINIYKDFERFLFTRELAEQTVSVYCGVAKLMEKYFVENYGLTYRNNLDSIKGYMVSNWATSIMSLKITTRKLYINAAYIFLRFLYSMQYVSFDLSAALPPIPNVNRYKAIHPDESTEKIGYTQEEIKAMMQAFPNNTFIGVRNRAIIATLTTTGLRVSELVSLNVSDPYTASDGFMRVARKGTHGNKMKVPLPANIMTYLNAYMALRREKGLPCDEDSPLFVTSAGKRLNRHRIYEAISIIQKKVGCHTGIHTFRHTALTHIAKNADPIVSRDVAGQKSIVITNQYLHSTDEEMQNAVNSLVELLP